MGCPRLTYYEGANMHALEKNGFSHLTVVKKISESVENVDGDYRYGFQGQEKDDEVKGKGNSLNYKYRMHDARLGRFFAVDPLVHKYPQWGPYNFSGNQVIHTSEFEGLEPVSDANEYGAQMKANGAPGGAETTPDPYANPTIIKKYELVIQAGHKVSGKSGLYEKSYKEVGTEIVYNGEGKELVEYSVTYPIYYAAHQQHYTSESKTVSKEDHASLHAFYLMKAAEEVDLTWSDQVMQSWSALGNNMIALHSVAVSPGFKYKGNGADAEIKTQRVGQWMSKEEYNAFQATGKIPRTNVLTKGKDGWSKQATKGDYFVEFDVNPAILMEKNAELGWSMVKPNNAMQVKLAAKKGIQLPPAHGNNITHTATK